MSGVGTTNGTSPEASMSGEMMAFLLTKPRPRVVGKTCQCEKLVDRGAHRERTLCTRPVWGDGRVNGDFHGLCSKHWHEWNAFHGSYLTMQANPASHQLGPEGIAKLTFAAQTKQLPEIGAEHPDTFPSEWLS